MSKIVIIIVCLLGFLIFSNLMLLPRYQNLEILNAQIGEKESELASKEEYFAQIQSLSQQLEQYSEEFSKIEFSLPDKPELAAFFQFLQRACSENGLILRNIKGFETKKPAKDEKINEIIIGFEVSGSFESLMNFLKTLEKSARIIDVLYLSFSMPKEGESTFVFDIKVKIHSW